MVKVHVNGSCQNQESWQSYSSLYFLDALAQTSQRTSEVYEMKTKRLPRGERCGRGEPNASNEQ